MIGPLITTVLICAGYTCAVVLRAAFIHAQTIDDIRDYGTDDPRLSGLLTAVHNGEQ